MTSKLQFLISVYLGYILLSILSILVTVEASTSGELSWNLNYDDSNRITKVTDPAGYSTRIQYIDDAENRLRKLIRTTADGTSTVLEFNEHGVPGELLIIA